VVFEVTSNSSKIEFLSKIISYKVSPSKFPSNLTLSTIAETYLGSYCSIFVPMRDSASPARILTFNEYDVVQSDVEDFKVRSLGL
jgi:hypothetical protein